MQKLIPQHLAAKCAAETVDRDEKEKARFFVRNFASSTYFCKQTLGCAIVGADSALKTVYSIGECIVGGVNHVSTSLPANIFRQG